MEHVTDKNIEQLTNTAVTLGKFDGLHSGHGKLICTMLEYAHTQRLRSAVFSFYPSPAEVLSGEKQDVIYSRTEKIWILEQMGVDVFIEYPFDRSLADTAPDEFVRDILYNQMKCRALIVGEGYRFGRDKAGDYDTLSQLGRQLGMEILRIAHVGLPGEKVSSSDIRRMIREGDFTRAESLLGRPYFIRGGVSPGRQTGRTLGFPTANLNIPDGKLTPQDGVYITKIAYRGEEFAGVSNVGYNPTFGGSEKRCETHILGFDSAIYGEEITVCFYKQLRPEIKFESVDALREQIMRDVSVARSYWKERDKERLV